MFFWTDFVPKKNPKEGQKMGFFGKFGGGGRLRFTNPKVPPCLGGRCGLEKKPVWGCKKGRSLEKIYKLALLADPRVHCGCLFGSPNGSPGGGGAQGLPLATFGPGAVKPPVNP